MGLIRDSSELKEAARLVGGLLGPLRRGDAPAEERPVTEAAVVDESSAEAVALPEYAELLNGGTRTGRIGAVLDLLLRRGGYDGAVLVEGNGLVAASAGAGYEEHALAALATELNRCRERMGEVFEDKPGGVVNLGFGTARADAAIMESGGAPFVLAGLSSEGDPDAGELAEAAGHIIGLLNSGVE